MLTKLWGIDPQKINLGVGLFSKRWKDFKLVGEPTWTLLSKKCPNAPFTSTKCDGVLVVSKKMMFDLGQLAQTHQLGGGFIWTLSYDSFELNNTLSNYWVQGYRSRGSRAKESDLKF